MYQLCILGFVNNFTSIPQIRSKSSSVFLIYHFYSSFWRQMLNLREPLNQMMCMKMWKNYCCPSLPSWSAPALPEGGGWDACSLPPAEVLAGTTLLSYIYGIAQPDAAESCHPQHAQCLLPENTQWCGVIFSWLILWLWAMWGLWALPLYSLGK